MSERADTAFLALVASAVLLVGALATSLVALGTTGLADALTTLFGLLSACVFFLTALTTLPLGPLVLVVLSATSATTLVRTLRRSRGEQQLLASLPLELASGDARMAVTPTDRRGAFCIGLLRPRVVVTRGLLDGLAADELEAAIAHEEHHARTRAPLKALLGRTIVRTFAWLPILADLLDRYLLVKELEADRAAIERTSPGALAAALREALAGNAPVGAIGLADHASVRIDRLLDSSAALPSLISTRRALLSIPAATALTFALLHPGQVGSGEMPTFQTMLTTMSMHGLPGMLLGLSVNLTLLLAARALLRRRRRN